jgi:hypothetical protein
MNTLERNCPRTIEYEIGLGTKVVDIDAVNMEERYWPGDRSEEPILKFGDNAPTMIVDKSPECEDCV